MNRSLITDEERAQLLADGKARAAGHAIDPLPLVRLFTPKAHVTWLLTELDQEDGDTTYGLVDLGLGMSELGTVQLSVPASITARHARLLFMEYRPIADRVAWLVSIAAT